MRRIRPRILPEWHRSLSLSTHTRIYVSIYIYTHTQREIDLGLQYFPLKLNILTFKYKIHSVSVCVCVCVFFFWVVYCPNHWWFYSKIHSFCQPSLFHVHLFGNLVLSLNYIFKFLGVQIVSQNILFEGFINPRLEVTPIEVKMRIID